MKVVQVYLKQETNGRRYKVTKLVDTTEFNIGQMLSKEAVDKLAVSRKHKVTIT